jgi:hypothetical protein
MFFKNREVLDLEIEKLTEFSFIKEIIISETYRSLNIGIIAVIFLSIVYFLISMRVKKTKLSLTSLANSYVKYLVITLLTGVLWIPIYLILTFSILISLIPSIAIMVPLFMGKEELFIPAIFLFIITFIIIMFILIIFSLYINFWYAEIFLKNKNVFTAFFNIGDFVKTKFLKLIPIGIGYLICFVLYMASVYKGFRNLYSGGADTPASIFVIIIIAGIINCFLCIQTFIFYNNEYNELEEEESLERAK